MASEEPKDVVTKTLSNYYRPYIRHNRKDWTAKDVRTLRRLLDEGTPVEVIAVKMGRTAGSIEMKASKDKKNRYKKHGPDALTRKGNRRRDG